MPDPLYRERMSLLRELARRPADGEPPEIRYDATRQVSEVLEHGRWVDSWTARVLDGTKKFDIETGEDAKGQ